jgi:23S rRNA pseudouridine2605 synthase
MKKRFEHTNKAGNKTNRFRNERPKSDKPLKSRTKTGKPRDEKSWGGPSTQGKAGTKKFGTTRRKPDFESEKPEFYGGKQDNYKTAGEKRQTVQKGTNKYKTYVDKKGGNQEKEQADKRLDRRKPNPPDYHILKKGHSGKPGTRKAPLESRIKKKEEEGKDTGEIRLNRFISNSGMCSRREADKLIEQGLVMVNGKVVTELGTKIKRSDLVKYNNKILRPEKPVYVLLNKPKDYITTTEDPEKRKTVMDLVANACDERIYPVGRLDRNTTGLLLLTNDGEMATRLAHPSTNIKKLYQVDLDKPVTKPDLDKLISGIELEDGIAIVDTVGIVTPDSKSLGVELHSGRNRVVRRMFESLGYTVIRLDRVMYAGLTKKDLPRGRWRYLTEQEVIRLKHFVK